jgi:hypothetical protein
MDIHENARLSPRGREHIVRLVQSGQTQNNGFPDVQCAPQMKGPESGSAFFNQSGDDSSKGDLLKASERSICKRNQAPQRSLNSCRISLTPSRS